MIADRRDPEAAGERSGGEAERPAPEPRTVRARAERATAAQHRDGVGGADERVGGDAAVGAGVGGDRPAVDAGDEDRPVQRLDLVEGGEAGHVAGVRGGGGVEGEGGGGGGHGDSVRPRGRCKSIDIIWT